MQAERLNRPASVFLDEHLGNPIPVLDHGFVRVIDYMGDDAAVVQAARVSYGKGTETVNSDRGLIRYLMQHWHSTPFEMCEIKLHVKLPIFVARQWIRHRTANVNEYSARYSILDREFYIPAAEQLAVQSTTNKQGRAEELTPDQALQVQAILMHDASTAYDSYERMLRPKDEGGEFGLARELARMNLPANVYTQWYWKVDLHNLLHFLRLRADPHAQWEIRQYANVICELVAGWVPYVWEAFNDYRLQGLQLSAMEVKFLRDLLADDPNEWLCEDQAKTYGMNAREAREFVAKFRPSNG